LVFSSTLFLGIFLPVTIFLYYLSKNITYKNIILLTASLLFYAWGEPVLILVMLFSSFVAYVSAFGVSKWRGSFRSKLCLIFSLVVVIGILVVYKYSAFLVDIVNALFGTQICFKGFALPLGISFYTFQIITYVIDVYRNDASLQRSYYKFLLYVSMFPQLVAGPIVRYSTIANELKDRKIIFDNIVEGFLRFLRGLFKKILIANNIGIMYETILASDLNQLSVLTLWLGIICYAVQIYFDFSGYSDMAIGIGKMLGFNFNENFDYPYISKSISEFWRRWHISLGTWFKDYVLYPFLKSDHIQKLQSALKDKCGKTVGKNITIALGTLLVFFLTGLWHGANYNFIFWGLYYAFFLIIEDIFLKKALRSHKILSHIYVCMVVLIGYVIFSIEDLSILSSYFNGLFGLSSLPLIDQSFVFYLTNYGLMIFIGIIFCMPIMQIIPNKIKDSMIFNILKGIVYVILFLVCICFIVSDSYNPFLYFRF